MTTILDCKDISHSFIGNNYNNGKKNGNIEKPILCNINLKIEQGQFVALVGPSGCGKSTLLNIIYGVLRPKQGQAYIYKNSNIPHKITRPDPDCAMVDQQYMLYPYLTALENVALGPKVLETTLPFRLFHPLKWQKLKTIQEATALKFLKKVELDNDAYSYPIQLSGGMKQRVAIAQAMINKPKVILLDEPFGALDEATREKLQIWLIKLYEENQQEIAKGNPPPYTILLVTHELNEAIFVADRILGLSQYWHWHEEGYKESPGATIVYDEPCPIYESDLPRDFLTFKERKDQIYKIVIDKEPNDERKSSYNKIKERNNTK